MPSSHAIIAAASDKALTERVVAVATTLGCATAEHDAQRLRRELVIAELDESGATIAAVYEYTCLAREQAMEARRAAIAAAEAAHPIPPEPGLNPAAVTDAHIASALMQLIGAEQVNANLAAVTDPGLIASLTARGLLPA
ncbi:MAG: hypothetical protein IPJ61_17550 [Tessaracoccus sp.]|uniref:hypothetical protein n=1 Tax=Tessaracoccus sp. TaxID=1971211 RepID=UPI001EB60C32|nr:hypothetical protein [Tessaracoccus sp.]MBK7822812.1 hypothetical protein [Tessaracoccus sp.]